MRAAQMKLGGWRTASAKLQRESCWNVRWVLNKHFSMQVKPMESDKENTKKKISKTLRNSSTQNIE
jgi:hypothetical protein